MKFNEILKELRIESGMSQKELATVLGVGRTTITMYESGEIVPRQDGLIKIANYFNVTTDYLTGASRNKSQQNVYKLDEELKKIKNRLDIIQAKSETIMYGESVLSNAQIAVIKKQIECTLYMIKYISEN